MNEKPYCHIDSGKDSSAMNEKVDIRAKSIRVNFNLLFL